MKVYNPEYCLTFFLLLFVFCDTLKIFPNHVKTTSLLLISFKFVITILCDLHLFFNHWDIKDKSKWLKNNNIAKSFKIFSHAYWIKLLMVWPWRHYPFIRGLYTSWKNFQIAIKLMERWAIILVAIILKILHNDFELQKQPSCCSEITITL